MAPTAEERLERILYILPAAAHRDGVRLSELARALDVEPAVILDDLKQAMDRSFYQPAGAVEQFTITVRGGPNPKVWVRAPNQFDRPVRLNQRETLALVLGLRSLAADRPDRRTEILQLAHRLERELVAPDIMVGEELAPSRVREERPDRVARPEPPFYGDVGAPVTVPDDVEYDEHALAFDDDGFRGTVADAIELRRTCTIDYLKPGDLTPMSRTIAPYRLVYSEGRWYVAAWDFERENLRFFRMDRVTSARVETEQAPAAPVELDALLQRGVPYSATDDVEVRVRYSPKIARWIRERTAVEPEPDGSVVVTHRVADPHWIARHVLQYAGEAVVDEPPLARTWVANAAANILHDDLADWRAR